MAIKLRLNGTVSDAPRHLTFTVSGVPRFSFGVRVGSLRQRTYRVTAYGSTARFGDHHLRSGDRVQVEGAYMRCRQAAAEELVRADTIRHIGRSVPPYAGARVVFVPRPPRAEDADPSRPTPHQHADDERSSASEAVVDDALTAALA